MNNDDNHNNMPNQKEVEIAIKTIIKWIGDDPKRKELVDTPKRVAKSLLDLYKGYKENPEKHLLKNFQNINHYEDIIIVKNIPFYSNCEHHMLPFIGEVHIGYYPFNKIVGLSKLARIVDIYSKRLQTQENLTIQIVSVINKILSTKGTAVMIEAQHQCISMRGVNKFNIDTVTTKFTGLFHNNLIEQTKFINLVKN